MNSDYQLHFLNLILSQTKNSKIYIKITKYMSFPQVLISIIIIKIFRKIVKLSVRNLKYKN